jgi:hypothetical protein
MTHLIIMFRARASYFLNDARPNHGWAEWIVRCVDNRMKIHWPHDRQFSNALATSTWQHHRQHDSLAPLPAWLSSDIMSLPAPAQQRHHQHDMGARQVLPRPAIRSDSRARRMPVQPTAQLRYTATYITGFNSRWARQHQQYYEILHQNN